MSTLLAKVLLLLAALLGEDEGSSDPELDRWVEAEDARNDELREAIQQDEDKAAEEGARDRLAGIEP